MGNTTDAMQGIDPSSVNIENIRGAVVGLNHKEIFWRPASGNGQLELSAISGKISLRVPKEVSDYDALAIVNGVRLGRLILLEKVVTIEPKPIQDKVPTADMITAQRLLDETDPIVFTSRIEKQSRAIAEACLDLEKAGGARQVYLDIIKGVLQAPKS